MSRSLRDRTSPMVRLRYPGHERIDVPYELFDLARRRTEFLHPLAPRLSLTDLLASAYAQGLADAGQALERDPRP